jgi:hypothetical protein
MSNWAESADTLIELAEIVDAAQQIVSRVLELSRAHVDCESVYEPLNAALSALNSAEQGLRDHAVRFADAARQLADDDDRGRLL